jgi:esterase
LTSLNLNFDSIGTGPPVIILHGLFGQGRNWAGIARGLSDTHKVLSVDLRNHGQSPWADEMTYEAMAADVAHLIESHTPTPVALIGHSMGGKVAMTLAMTRPELIQRLCIVDIAPVPYSHDFENHLKAMANLDITGITRRAEAEAALLEQLDDPFLTRFLIRNLKAHATPTGGFSWSVNLAALAVHMDDILDFPVFEADQAYEGAALFLAGGNSDYIQPYHQGEIERLFPMAETEIIDGAGHWLHADKPDVITARLADFLGT